MFNYNMTHNYIELFYKINIKNNLHFATLCYCHLLKYITAKLQQKELSAMHAMINIYGERERCVIISNIKI